MATKTAAQQRAEAKIDYDAFLAQCPSRQLLDRITDKWVALILAALGGNGQDPDGAGGPRPMRYSELSRRLAGVSQKMLTRTVTPTVPATVTYELTGLGLSLHQLMLGIKTWAEAHMDEVLAHRDDHDAAHADRSTPVRR